MKRDANIAPLSRDHHHSLLFCWKIRRGMAKGVDLERIRLYIIYFYKTHLEKHFLEEEALLFRVIDDPLCLRALAEHRRIRDLVTAIEGSDTRQAEYYGGLADLVEVHVRFEERQLFPFLEQRLSNEQLSKVGDELNRMHDHPASDLYEDDFWN